MSLPSPPDAALRPRYYEVMLGKCCFCIDVRYQNLRPVSGARGPRRALPPSSSACLDPRSARAPARIRLTLLARAHLPPAQIGRGAYGLVASAEDTTTGFKVAIKRVTRLFQDLIDAKRILREVKLLRHLSMHENVVGLVDIMTAPPETEDFHSLYIVTHLFECDLDRIINSAQALSDQHAQYFVYQMLRGLKMIHSASVLHRDLKPSNLLVNSNCDLAICDFGLARGVADLPASSTGSLTEYVVTRWYRAPELLCEATTYGPPVDVWSVGW